MSLSNNTNPKVLLPDEQSIKTEFIVAGVLLAIIGFFGFFLNLIVIVVIIKDARNLWTPVNVVLLNMVVGLFLKSKQNQQGLNVFQIFFFFFLCVIVL